MAGSANWPGWIVFLQKNSVAFELSTRLTVVPDGAQKE
jgi:hypothetical protein